MALKLNYQLLTQFLWKVDVSPFANKIFICDSTSTSNTNNVEIIQAQLNKLTVTSVFKPPNEQFSFGSILASTQINVVIGDFNSHGVEWGYRSTDKNGRLVEQWSETNQLSLVHDAKQPKSYNSKRWQQGYNPYLAFVSYSIAHLAEKDVMDAIPKTQHIPISIKLNAVIRPRNVSFRRRYNLKKAKWQSYAKEVGRVTPTHCPKTTKSSWTCKEIIKQGHPTRLPYELCMWLKRSVQRYVWRLPKTFRRGPLQRKHCQGWRCTTRWDIRSTA